MYSTPANYLEDYTKALRKAPWYKQPITTKTLKITQYVAFIALFVIASLSAHALAVPSSSIGVIGHHLVGIEGLITLIIVGFPIVSPTLILQICTQRSIFNLSDSNARDKGFLYVIKDEGSNTKGYLYGTMHILPNNWKGLNQQVTTSLDECGEIFVECEIPSVMRFLASFQCLIKGKQEGADYKVIDYAQENDISLTFLEAPESQIKKMLFQTDEDRQIGGSLPPSPLSKERCDDYLTLIWQKGDKDGMVNAPFNGTPRSFIQRHKDWVPIISKALEDSSEKPVFIAVGCGHLFDIPHMQIKGLISFVRESHPGWRIEEVGDVQVL